MQKGPLVYLAVVFAALLMVLSMTVVLMPEMVETLAVVSGIVVAATMIVLLAMLVKMRKVR